MKIRGWSSAASFATTPPGCFLASQERNLRVFYILPPQSTLRSLNATSVAKCKQLTCLCASPYRQGTFGNQSNSKNKSLLFRCKTKKGVQSVSRAQEERKRAARQSECICVSGNSVRRKQNKCCFLLCQRLTGRVVIPPWKKKRQ